MATPKEKPTTKMTPTEFAEAGFGPNPTGEQGTIHAPFVPPPYTNGNTCQSIYETGPEPFTRYMCCRAPGHPGLHGHPDLATEWSDEQELADPGFAPGSQVYINDVPIGTVSGSFEMKLDAMEAYKPEQAKVEIIIASGKPAAATGVRINGWKVPKVKAVSVEYDSGGARTVVLEIIATDLIEVET